MGEKIVSMVYSDVTPCGNVDNYQCFSWMSTLNLDPINSFETLVPIYTIHGVTTQKTVILIYIAMKTSNLRLQDGQEW
jgi:hypothetical protein